MTNDSPAWNAYGPHHGIVVVDMQPDYLFQEKSLQIHVSKLISNVAGQVSACLQGGGKVIIVEFANRGETVKQIKENIVHQSGIKLFSKNFCSLFHENNEQLKSVRRFFLKEKRQRTRFTIVGVHTGACIRDTAIGMDKMGIEARVLVGSTMNTQIPAFNRLSHIKDRYRLYPWLLDFGAQPERKDFQLLTDYL